MCTHLATTEVRCSSLFCASVSIEKVLRIRRVSFHQVTHTTLVEVTYHCSTLAPTRPLVVGNMCQRGYPSHSMTGGDHSVMSIYLACHVHTSSYLRPDPRSSAAVLQSVSKKSCDSGTCPFIRLHTQLRLRHRE